jgi:uncharacterized membrane protein YhaH (DUF805 family)
VEEKGMDPQVLAQSVIEIFRRNVMEHYFDMNGRVSRQEFWYFVLGWFVVALGAALIDAIVHTGLLVAAVELALLLPLASIAARRLQDTGKIGSAVWLAAVPTALYCVLVALAGPFGIIGLLVLWPFLSLIGLVAIVAMLWIGYLCAQPGTVGPNQFGPEPANTVGPAPKAAI